MTNCGIRMFSAAMLAVALSATSALADRDLVWPDRSSAAGDWSCQLGDRAVGTLSVRMSSYVFSRSGVSMAGEYQQTAERVDVTNGPLRGLGVQTGILDASILERTLEFATAGNGMLFCREVL